MEDGLLTEHFDLLTKTRSTIERILASGSSDIWSTYGALRRAREILHHIFIHGLLADSEEVCSYRRDIKFYSIYCHCLKYMAFVHLVEE